MGADDVNLSDDEVRARFSMYHDGELPEPEAAVVRKKLGESAQLAAEYDLFAKMLTGLAGLGNDVPTDAKPGVELVERVDLLGSIQQRIYKRSGGRFYKSRFARATGVLPLELFAAGVLVLLLIGYVCVTYVSSLEPAQPQSAPTSTPTMQQN